MEVSWTSLSGGRGRFVWWRPWEGPQSRAGVDRAAKTLPWVEISSWGFEEKFDVLGGPCPWFPVVWRGRMLPKGPALPGPSPSQHRGSLTSGRGLELLFLMTWTKVG